MHRTRRAAVMVLWALSCLAAGAVWCYPIRYGPAPSAEKLAGLEEQAQARPDDRGAAGMLFSAYLAAGRLDDAEAELARLAAMPGAEPGEIRLRRTQLLVVRGEIDAALLTGRELAEEADTAGAAAMAWYYLGDLLRECCERAAARDAYTRAVELFPASGQWAREALGGLASITPDRGRKAMLWTLAAAMVAPAEGAPEGTDPLAVDAPLAAMAVLAKTAPDDPLLLRVMAQRYLDLGLRGEAVAVARRAAELAPEECAAHLLLGRALRETGAADEAIAALDDAVRTSARYTDIAAVAHLWLASLCEAKGDADRAFTEYSQAMFQVMEEPWSPRRLAVLGFRADRVPEAIDCLNRAEAPLKRRYRSAYRAQWVSTFEAAKAALCAAAGDAEGLSEALSSYLAGGGEGSPEARECTQLLAEAPQEAAALFLIAVVLGDDATEDGRAQMVASLREAVRIAPEFGLAYLYLAQMVTATDREEAAELAEAAATKLPADGQLAAGARRMAEDLRKGDKNG